MNINRRSRSHSPPILLGGIGVERDLLKKCNIEVSTTEVSGQSSSAEHDAIYIMDLPEQSDEVHPNNSSNIKSLLVAVDDKKTKSSVKEGGSQKKKSVSPHLPARKRTPGRSRSFRSSSSSNNKKTSKSRRGITRSFSGGSSSLIRPLPPPPPPPSTSPTRSTAISSGDSLSDVSAEELSTSLLQSVLPAAVPRFGVGRSRSFRKSKQQSSRLSPEPPSLSRGVNRTMSGDSSSGDMSLLSMMSNLSTHRSTRRISRDMDNIMNESFHSIVGSEIELDIETSSKVRLSCKELIAKNPNQNQNLPQDISINKLQVASLSLYDREEQTKTLKDCFDRLLVVDDDYVESSTTQHCRRRQLVWIGGDAGYGKTSLAMTMKDQIRNYNKQQKKQEQHQEGVFFYGKFDMNTTTGSEYHSCRPFSAISSACNDLCQQIIRRKHQILRSNGYSKQEKTIQAYLIDELGVESTGLLAKIIPSLSNLMNEFHDSNGSCIKNEEIPYEVFSGGFSTGTKRKLHYAFQKFLHAISSYYTPAIMVLDDLQWADAASLSLLESAVLDETTTAANKNSTTATSSEPCDTTQLMVIGCYRTDEVNETHVLSSTMRDIEGRRHRQLERTHGFRNCKKIHGSISDYEITNLHVGPLPMQSVQRFVMDLLSIDGNDEDAPRVSSLADLCYKRTLGNAHFLLSFLTMLHEEGLLVYNLGSMQWTWNESDIRRQTAATKNVVDMLAQKLDKLPSKDLKQFLLLAACLGSTFTERIIALVWVKYNNNRSSMSGMLQGTRPSALSMLELGIENSLIERSNDDTFQWLHDNVHVAALAMISEESLLSLKQQVGQILYTYLSVKERDASIFVLVNLLDGVSRRTSSKSVPAGMVDAITRVELATLNLQAAEKAMGMSAFNMAARYASQGIDLLLAASKEAAWTVHFDLTLQLYTIGAESEGLQCNFESMKAYCEAILSSEKATIIHKERAYLIYARILFLL